MHQSVLILSVVSGSWLGMQAIHEFGHVLGSWLTGGQIAKVVLYPLTISRTDLTQNPNPLFVVWCGPIVGVLLPLVLWDVAARLRWPAAFALRFFAGFCLIANGAYIAGGSFNRVGDCGQMLQNGSAVWQLWLFGVLTVPLGLRLWHGQGSYFGLGPAPEKISPGIAYGSLLAFGLLLALDFLVDGK